MRCGGDLDAAGQRRPFTVVEATIPEMRTALEQHRITSVEIVTQYLTRIAIYEDLLHATLHVNRRGAQRKRPSAIASAPPGASADRCTAFRSRSKTTSTRPTMPTTGGALAFDGFMPPYEATLVTNLSAAGAIIIAKTGMTELANWVAGAPTPMPTNYNAVGGFGFNPYDPRRDPRPATFDGRPALETGGSSSGIGTAANFWAANVGTETSGSILSPSNQNMLAGIKPTVGRISRYGVIPITADQDTPGPMAKSVTDAAIMLGALEGAPPDPNDPATAACTPPPNATTRRSCEPTRCKGARIGIPRAFFYEPAPASGGDRPRGGLDPEQAAAMADAIGVLRSRARSSSIPPTSRASSTPIRGEQLPAVEHLFGDAKAAARTTDCSIVFKYGMKRDFNAWLASLGPSAPVKSLTELREWNTAHSNGGAIKYGQVQPRYLRRDGRRARSRPLRGGPREGSAPSPPHTGSTR